MFNLNSYLEIYNIIRLQFFLNSYKYISVRAVNLVLLIFTAYNFTNIYLKSAICHLSIN